MKILPLTTAAILTATSCFASYNSFKENFDDNSRGSGNYQRKGTPYQEESNDFSKETYENARAAGISAEELSKLRAQENIFRNEKIQSDIHTLQINSKREEIDLQRMRDENEYNRKAGELELKGKELKYSQEVQFAEIERYIQLKGQITDLDHKIKVNAEKEKQAKMKTVGTEIDGRFHLRKTDRTYWGAAKDNFLWGWDSGIDVTNKHDAISRETDGRTDSQRQLLKQIDDGARPTSILRIQNASVSDQVRLNN